MSESPSNCATHRAPLHTPEKLWRLADAKRPTFHLHGKLVECGPAGDAGLVEEAERD